MVSGVIICGFGLGSFIFSFLSTLLANPQNLNAQNEIDGMLFYGPEVANRVPGMINKLALSWGIICSISLTCLRPLKSQDQDLSETTGDDDIDIK